MNDEHISKHEAVNAVKSLISKMPARDNYAKGYDAALGRALIAVREVPAAEYALDELCKSKDVQPLSAVAEHIKNRLYETALNTQNEEASKTIEAMAERIYFWINELKDGDTND